MWIHGPAAAALLERTVTGVSRLAAWPDYHNERAAFAGARLERVLFAGCTFTGSDWQGARLKLVVFDGCDLTDADFTGTRFE